MADSKISQLDPKGILDTYDIDQDFLPVAKNNGVDGNRKYSLRNIKEAVDALIPWNLTTTPDVLPVTAMPGSFLEVTVAGSYLTTVFEEFDLGIVLSDGISVIRIPYFIASETFVLDTVAAAEKPQVISLACSDETSALTTGIKLTFRMPYAMDILEVRASLTTLNLTDPTIVDIHLNGTSIFTVGNLLTIDPEEETSVTGTPYVLATTSFPDNAKVEIWLTDIGAGVPEGLKVYLIGTVL